MHRVLVFVVLGALVSLEASASRRTYGRQRYYNHAPPRHYGSYGRPSGSQNSFGVSGVHTSSFTVPTGNVGFNGGSSGFPPAQNFGVGNSGGGSFGVGRPTVQGANFGVNPINPGVSGVHGNNVGVGGVPLNNFGIGGGQGTNFGGNFGVTPTNPGFGGVPGNNFGVGGSPVTGGTNIADIVDVRLSG